MKTFCQICRHPSDEGIGHEPNCPVYTGEPVPGNSGLQGMMVTGQQLQQAAMGLSQMGMGNQSMPCPHCGGYGGQHIWAGSGSCPGVSTHWTQHGQDLRLDRILERLNNLEEENKRIWRTIKQLQGRP